MASARTLSGIPQNTNHPAGLESVSLILMGYFLGIPEFVENTPEKQELATYHVGPCHPRCRHALKPRCTEILVISKIPQICGCGGRGHSEAIRATNHTMEEFEGEETTSSPNLLRLWA